MLISNAWAQAAGGAPGGGDFISSLLPLVLCVLVLIGSAAGKQRGRYKIPVPGFLLVFFALALLTNTGVVTDEMADSAAEVSKWLLIAAISALGAKTSLRSLSSVGGAKVVRIGRPRSQSR